MIPEENKKREKIIRHNASQIAKLIEFTDASQRGTMGSFGNLENVKRKSYKVPISAFALRFWSNDENTYAAKLLIPILQDLQARSPSIYLPFFLVERNPTLLRNWKRQSTPHEIEMFNRFRTLCRFVAVKLYNKTKHLPDGSPRIFVVVDPDDEEARAKTNQAHGQERTFRKEHSYRLIGPEVGRVKEEESCTLKAAIARVADMTDNKRGLPCSIPRVEAAYYFWKSKEEIEKESA